MSYSNVRTFLLHILAMERKQELINIETTIFLYCLELDLNNCHAFDPNICAKLNDIFNVSTWYRVIKKCSLMRTGDLWVGVCLHSIEGTYTVISHVCFRQTRCVCVGIANNETPPPPYWERSIGFYDFASCLARSLQAFQNSLWEYQNSIPDPSAY